MTTKTIDLSHLKRAYYALISQYVHLLRDVATGRDVWVIRQIIEDHIRIILREIIEAFTLYEHAFLNRVPEEDLSWLRQEREYLTVLADQLANFRQQVWTYAWRGLTLLWASALLEFAAATDQTDQTGNLIFLLSNVAEIIQTLMRTFGLLLLLLGIVFMALMLSIFGIKRGYLKPGYDAYDIRRAAISQTETGVNIYKLENNLFGMMGRKKPVEIPWDAWAGVLLGVSVGGLLYATVFPLPPGLPDNAEFWTTFVIVLMVVAFSGPLIRVARDREK